MIKPEQPELQQSPIAMEETKRKFPSLPANYVSLQQLQEQRLREQQQKQKEKEEEEEQRLIEKKEKKQQQQQQKEEEEKKRLLVSQKTPRIRTKTSYDQTSFNRNGRNFSQKSWLIKEKSEAVVVVLNPDQKLEEIEQKRQKKKKKNKYKKVEAEINVGVEAEQLPDLDHQNLKEIETKKKRKRYKGKKPMVEEQTLTLTLIEEDMKESLPPATIPNENDADAKNTRTGFRRRNQKPPPESVNQTIEIEQKIGDLRIRDDDDDEKKSTVEKKKNGDYYSGVMHSRKMINRRKPMDRNLMWIRKDEKTDEFPVVSGYIAGKISKQILG